MNKNIKYDLHIHTTLSDGTFGWKDIVLMAKNQGLAGISITDHDVIYDNLDEIRTYADSQNILFVHGIEFSSKMDNVHILGYNIDVNSEDLKKYLLDEQAKRQEAVKEMCAMSVKYNVPVAYEEVLELAKNNSAIGRPHIAAVLQKKGYIKNIYEAFQKWLRKGRPLYVPYDKNWHWEIIEKIKSWNGVPVLAHFSLIAENLQKKIFEESLSAGLAGMEVFYPRFNSYQTQHLYQMATQHSLIMTGGSDFHGTNKPDIHLGDAGLTEENFSKIKDTLVS